MTHTRAVFALLACVSLSLSGCTSFRYTTAEGGTVAVTRVLSRAAVGKLTVECTDAAGKVTKRVIVEGYQSNPDSTAIKAAVEGAVKGLQ